MTFGAAAHGEVRRSPLHVESIDCSSPIVQAAAKAMSPRVLRTPVSESGSELILDVTRVGVGPLFTRAGQFHQFEFRVSDQWNKYVALVHADLDEDFMPVFRSQKLLLRIDSGCETGQRYGDLTCDCADQLHRALLTIVESGEGLVINIPDQDGRGLGVSLKLATLFVQQQLGVDTVEASALLDPLATARDQRTYAGVIGILKFFGIPTTNTICLLSNNPNKLEIFKQNGFTNSELMEITIPPTEHTYKHLRAKQEYFGHLNLVR